MASGVVIAGVTTQTNSRVHDAQIGPDGKTLESSEFTREANLGFSGSITGVLGVPDIRACWVRSRWRVLDDQIEGIVIDYKLPTGVQDPQKANAKIKYRITMVRVS